MTFYQTTDLSNLLIAPFASIHKLAIYWYNIYIYIYTCTYTWYIIPLPCKFYWYDLVWLWAYHGGLSATLLAQDDDDDVVGGADGMLDGIGGEVCHSPDGGRGLPRLPCFFWKDAKWLKRLLSDALEFIVCQMFIIGIFPNMIYDICKFM